MNCICLHQEAVRCSLCFHLFLYTVVLINSILVFRGSDAKQRSQFFTHVITHCKKANNNTRKTVERRSKSANDFR